MLEPIRARFASSCSKNGINEAAIDTSCFGETSIKEASLGSISRKSPLNLAVIRSEVNCPESSKGLLAWAMTSFSSWSAVR